MGELDKTHNTVFLPISKFSINFADRLEAYERVMVTEIMYVNLPRVGEIKRKASENIWWLLLQMEFFQVNVRMNVRSCCKTEKAV